MNVDVGANIDANKKANKRSNRGSNRGKHKGIGMHPLLTKRRDILRGFETAFDVIKKLNKHPEKIRQIPNKSTMVNVKGHLMFLPQKDVEVKGEYVIIKNKNKKNLFLI